MSDYVCGAVLTIRRTPTADYVWLEEIDRLEVERNDGKTLDGYDILETKKLTLLESLTLEDELRTPTGQYEFTALQRVGKLQKDGKTITRYYSVADFMDVDASGKKLKRGLDVLKAYVCQESLAHAIGWGRTGSDEVLTAWLGVAVVAYTAMQLSSALHPGNHFSLCCDKPHGRKPSEKC